MKQLFAIVIIPLLIAGCSTLMPATERASDKIADGVQKYCAEVSAEGRATLRQKVNDKLPEGASIVVTCPGN